MMTERAHLHALVESLPEAEIRPAVRFLEFLTKPYADSVLQALAQAPLDDEPFTDEDREALQEAFEDRDQGRVYSHEEVRRELLG